jgi:hypothetical protein
MRKFYTQVEMHAFRGAQTLPGFTKEAAKKLGSTLFFVLGPALMTSLIMFGRVLQDRRLRFMIAALAVFALGLVANAFFMPHYLAPFTGAFYAILMQAMRHLRTWCAAGEPVGLLLVRLTVVVCFALVGVRLAAQPLKLHIGRWPAVATWYGLEPIGIPRARIQAELMSRPGRQLALVRYAPDHVVLDDWVYNVADIDHSKVVWAREMDARSNAELLQYFKDRTAWLVEPDRDPPSLSPYPEPSPKATVVTGASFGECRRGKE